ncbi:solute carrier family 39 (zinc transporter), member 1/2/3 [Sporothrix brasiliensis 5110]|uniref:Solute carrier family 39 (Zinc transporter), member 1/2/3 n=1 Tax=Sporothrix brasiliensis 5110 TaxID=1398154 RepID=A0A0C2ELD7_9PEZI|nr:solute carrier family 39 (zinc transporter), member 1/2/3 [Sporothrix brasiliensis 5110]KIH86909.1 solute carrier family 39 (zinc transporter), member 1/2/3 [Sporothrix brasiliensis 5110]
MAHHHHRHSHNHQHHEFEFDPNHVDLTMADPKDIICFLSAGENEYDGRLGARISALFVILITSLLCTLFPVVATRIKRLRIPVYVYLFARYFGAGVIIATAFIHLLDPAYAEIGPASCVGLTGGWAGYSWPPCLAMIMVMLTFLLDFGAEWFVDKKYNMSHGHGDNIAQSITLGGDKHRNGVSGEAGNPVPVSHPSQSHQFLHSADQDGSAAPNAAVPHSNSADDASNEKLDLEKVEYAAASNERAFREQFAAFLILEFGVIFHSVIIGLNLGVVGEEFNTLYPVIVFHQAFEGLGIGARLSAIPFPARPGKFLKALPWLLCAAYGLTTPIAIAVGLGVRTTYNDSSFTANVVSGVLDSISAGILIYTGLVELLARDFLFNPERSRDGKRVTFMLVSLFLGVAIMALLGKWA